MPLIIIDSDKKAEEKEKEMTAVEFVKKLKKIEQLEINARKFGAHIDHVNVGTCYCQD